MPFKSHAQRERCRRLVAEGTMTQEQFDASDAETNLAELPDRLHPKKEANRAPDPEADL